MTSSPTEEPSILGEPTQIGYFSVSDNVVLPNSTVSLPYFREPPLGVSLTEGVDAFMRKYRSDQDVYHARPLDNIFRVLGPGNKKVFQEASVITWRGIVYKIMLGLKMSLNMSFIDGVLYLDEHDPKPKRPQVSAGGYAGHAFEALCTTPTPPASPIQVTQTTADINLHNLWGSVISRKLGDLRLLVCGEVDCVQEVYTGDPGCFLEIKSQKMVVKNARQSYKKWYLQSYVLGINQIFIGRHTGPESTLTTTELIQVSDLPSRVSGWNAEADIIKGERILAALRQFCADAGESEDKVWRVAIGTLKDTELESYRPLEGVTKVYTRDLSVEERNQIQKSRRGIGRERIGIIPKVAVQQLRS